MAPEQLRRRDALKTYRYLRIGMIVAVVLLGASIAIERSKVACWQTSISAYYYTPVRAIFVGSMIAVGFALVVIKGRTIYEDLSLNLAGMLAPVVAIAPTTDIGPCWSVPPTPRPIDPDGSLAHWVTINVQNNFSALLIAGAVGLVVAAALAVVLHFGFFGTTVEPVESGTWLSLVLTALAMGLAWWLMGHWGDFYSRAHGFAAVGMFACLIVTVAIKAGENMPDSTKYVVLYAGLAALMVTGGLAIRLFDIGGDNTVAVLEAFEIVLFALFWLFQTVENWNEQVA